MHELTFESLASLKNSHFGVLRILPMMTFSLDYWWGKGSLYAFHVTNIVVHVLSFLGCLWLLKGLFVICHEAGESERRDSADYAVMVAALWALHPVQTSAVTYLVQRMASMQAFFFMVSAAAFTYARLSAQAQRSFQSYLYYSICFISAFGAFLSKENSATLPIILFFIEIYFFRPRFFHLLQTRLRNAFRSYKAWIAGLFSLAFVVYLSSEVLRYFAAGYEGRHFTMEQRLLTQVRVVIQYCYAILVPNPGVLSIEHDVPISTSLFSPPTTFLCLLALGGLLGIVVYTFRRVPLVSFGILWFLINLSVESTIVPLELKFDHRMYLPSVGLILAAVETAKLIFGLCFAHYSQREKRALSLSLALTLCAALSLMTFARNQAWENILTINEDAVKKAPNNPRAHANYAVALARAGRFDEAITQAHEAIALGREGFEDYIVATTCIVTTYMQQAKWDKAIEEGERLLASKPKKFDAVSLPILYLKIAYCYRMQQDFAKALSYVFNAFETMKISSVLRSDRRWAYAELDNLIEELRESGSLESIKKASEDSLCRNALAIEEWVVCKLFELEDYEAAELLAAKASHHALSEEVLRQISLQKNRSAEQGDKWRNSARYLENPWDLSNLFLLVAYLIQKEENLKFLKHIGLVLLHLSEKRKPESPDVALLLAWYASENRQVQEAVSKAKHAIELAPQWAKAWIALGFFEQQAGRLENALAAFQHTLELYPGYPKRQVLKELMAKLETEIHAASLDDAKMMRAALYR